MPMMHPMMRFALANQQQNQLPQQLPQQAAQPPPMWGGILENPMFSGGIGMMANALSGRGPQEGFSIMQDALNSMHQRKKADKFMEWEGQKMEMEKTNMEREQAEADRELKREEMLAKVVPQLSRQIQEGTITPQQLLGTMGELGYAEEGLQGLAALAGRVPQVVTQRDGLTAQDYMTNPLSGQMTPFGGEYQRFRQPTSAGGGGGGGGGGPSAASYRPLAPEERAAFGIPENAGSYMIGKSGKPERIPGTEPKPLSMGRSTSEAPKAASAGKSAGKKAGAKAPKPQKPAATTAADVETALALLQSEKYGLPGTEEKDPVLASSLPENEQAVLARHVADLGRKLQAQTGMSLPAAIQRVIKPVSKKSAQGAAQAESRKKIGNVSYVKRGGQWFQE